MEFSLPIEVYRNLPIMFWVRESSSSLLLAYNECLTGRIGHTWAEEVYIRLIVIGFTLCFPYSVYLHRGFIIHDVIKNKSIYIHNKKNRQILQITQLLYGIPNER